MLKNIFAKNRRKNLHKHPGPPFQIRPGPGYFSRAKLGIDFAKFCVLVRIYKKLRIKKNC